MELFDNLLGVIREEFLAMLSVLLHPAAASWVVRAAGNSLHQLGAIQTTTRHGQTCPATRLKPKHRSRKRAINAEVHWARVGSLITFLAKQAAASRRIPASSDRMTDLCNGCAIEVVVSGTTHNCTYGMSCPCSRELVARLTTACVSSPRAWAASIFSHMLQGLGISVAPPHPGALCSPASNRSPLKPGSKNRRKLTIRSCCFFAMFGRVFQAGMTPVFLVLSDTWEEQWLTSVVELQF